MYQTQNPDFKKVIEEKLTRQYFMKHIRFDLTKIEAGLVEGEMPILEIHQQQNGALHGGLISTLCDIVAGFAAFSLVPPNKHVVTAEIKVSYLWGGKGEKVFAKGWVLKPGSKLHFCESEVWTENSGEQKMIAKATTTMAVIDHFV